MEGVGGKDVHLGAGRGGEVEISGNGMVKFSCCRGWGRVISRTEKIKKVSSGCCWRGCGGRDLQGWCWKGWEGKICTYGQMYFHF